MEKITIEQARESEEYIALKEDEVNDNMHIVSYYSISPYSDPKMAKKGWEKITYYISKNDLVWMRKKTKVD